MCGFIAWLGERPDPGSLAEQTAQLSHRGPDDSGSWRAREGRVALLHRRLSIIDLDRGAQPMTRDSTAIAYNGETYNYRELRKKLQHAGFSFSTDSDTEVLLRGYQHWGVELLDRIRGMFAFALWDGDRDQMLLARDPLGQKPLFYSAGENYFAAASELQVLLDLPGLPGRVNPGVFRDYFNLGYVPAPETAVKNIKKLPPGSYLTCSPAAQPQVHSYWSPLASLEREEEVDFSPQQLRSKLTESVRRRLVSDVPVGAFLSGGIDSSIIVGLMQQLTDQPVQTVTVGFGDADYDERDYARQTAGYHGTAHHEFTVETDLSDLLPRLVRHFGEPFADSSAVPTYYVAQQTRRVVKVALAGDGGDELFGGYRRYRAMHLLKQLRRFSPQFVRRLIQNISRRLGLPGRRRSTVGELLRLAQHLGESPVQQYQMMVGIGGGRLLKNILAPEFFEQINSDTNGHLTNLEQKISADLSEPERYMLLDLLSYLPGDLLVKTDVTTMLNSLECRCPFLDRDLVEFALRLPLNHKIRRTTGKICLRETFSDLLPDRIEKRGKMGFGVPLARWFRESPEAAYLEQVLMEKSSGFFNYVDREALEEQLSRQQSGELDISPFLWSLTIFKLWLTELPLQS